MNNETPLTRAVLEEVLAKALATNAGEIKTYVDERIDNLETRLVKYIDERIDNLETRLVKYIDERIVALETRLIEYIDERTHDSETRLLRAFGDYQEAETTRFRHMKADLGNLNVASDERLAALERRISEIDKRLIQKGI